MRALTITMIWVSLLLLAGCEDKFNDPKDRRQSVFESLCSGTKIIIYQPVNTIGLQYDAQGRELSGIRSCVHTHLGYSDTIGGEVTSHHE